MIMVSPTGARLTKADHPAVPITIAEIVETTVECAAAGAEALHLHIRDREGRHSLDAGLYAEALTAIDQALPDFLVQITTESAGRYGPDDQCTLLEKLAPKWASISLREVAQDHDLARRIYAICHDSGTSIQHIVYTSQDAETLRMWQTEGVLGRDESVILVLGSYANARAARPTDLAPLLRSLPPVDRWMVCAFGPTEHACLHHAARFGGDLRVGFENSTTNDEGIPWPNVQSSVLALLECIDQTA